MPCKEQWEWGQNVGSDSVRIFCFGICNSSEGRRSGVSFSSVPAHRDGIKDILKFNPYATSHGERKFQKMTILSIVKTTQLLA